MESLSSESVREPTSRGPLPRIVTTALLSIVLVSGCSDSPPEAKGTADSDLSIGFPAGGSDSGVLTDASIPAPRLHGVRGNHSVTDANARLASFDAQRDSKSDFDWKLNRLKQAMGPPALKAGSVLVQQGGTPPIEVVPTPNAKVDAEMIPTPTGEREGEPGNGDPRKAMGPEDYADWPAPAVTLVVTGQQHGYIEPCGCTGLDKQKGGVARRMTFMKQLQARGWDLLPIDAGNQVRRIGQQAALKFSWSADSLKQMHYQAVGFGPDDLRLSAIDLLQVAAADDPASALYISANVVLIDPSFVPTYKVIDRGAIKVGVTTVIDPEAIKTELGEDFTIKPAKESAAAALEEMNDGGATFRVLSFFGGERGSEEAAKKLVIEVPGYDLVIAAGGYGEPTYQPEQIEGSKTKLIVTGNKAMYAGLVGLYEDAPMKYARVPLTHEFGDDPAMRKLMADYQQQLQDIGLEGLGIRPVVHNSGQTFTGSKACGVCHTNAYDLWKDSMHAEATANIIEPKEERGDVPRNFDPECLSCHVTGWIPERYYPYESGYLNVAMEHLHGNGCENCHGPGSDHAAAEQKDSGADEEKLTRLRASMRLPLEKAREHCMKCHDLDNSPDFHEEDAFEDVYWPEIEHHGMD